MKTEGGCHGTSFQSNRIIQVPVGYEPAIASKPLDVGAEQASRTLLVIDTRVRDRECLAGSIAARRPDMNVLALGSLAEWHRIRELHPPLSAVLLNIGGRSFSDPTVANGVRNLVSECGATPVIAMADSDELREIFQALDCGVRGYIPSTMGIGVCVEAVNLALAGGIFIPASSILAAQHMLGKSEAATKQQASIFTNRQSESWKRLSAASRTRSSRMNSTCKRARSRFTSATS